MAPSPVHIHTFPLTGPTAQKTITGALDLLRPYLPESLPLYRRLQFGRFFSSSVLLTNLATLSVPDQQQQDLGTAQPQEWILAFVDRSVRPETEIWLSTWDSTPPFSGTEDEREEILRSLLRAVKDLEIPRSIHGIMEDEMGGESRDASSVSRAEYAGHWGKEDIVLCGAIDPTTTRMLDRLGVLAKGKETPTTLVSNGVFVFDLKKQEWQKDVGDLPTGLRWGELKHSNFALVKSRTQIPRQDKTLAVLPHLAILDKEQPVAWAFIGLDGALTTLHVEERYRRQGLAKMITKKLFREKMDFLWEEDMERMAHAYVVEGNQASCAVCESLGGKADWEVFWVRLDLEAVK